MKSREVVIFKSFNRFSKRQTGDTEEVNDLFFVAPEISWEGGTEKLVYEKIDKI